MTMEESYFGTEKAEQFFRCIHVVNELPKAALPNSRWKKYWIVATLSSLELQGKGDGSDSGDSSARSLLRYYKNMIGI